MNIRREEPKDYRECENVTREAFWNVYKPGCAEHYVLHTYRNKPEFVPELDFVLEEDGKIIGHVMFVRAKINAENTNPEYDSRNGFSHKSTSTTIPSAFNMS